MNCGGGREREWWGVGGCEYRLCFARLSLMARLDERDPFALFFPLAPFTSNCNHSARLESASDVADILDGATVLTESNLPNGSYEPAIHHVVITPASYVCQPVPEFTPRLREESIVSSLSPGLSLLLISNFEIFYTPCLCAPPPSNYRFYRQPRVESMDCGGIVQGMMKFKFLLF